MQVQETDSSLFVTPGKDYPRLQQQTEPTNVGRIALKQPASCRLCYTTPLEPRDDIAGGGGGRGGVECVKPWW